MKQVLLSVFVGVLILFGSLANFALGAPGITAYVTMTDFACYSSQNSGHTGELIIFHCTSPNSMEYDGIAGRLTITGNVTNAAVPLSYGSGYFTCVFNDQVLSRQATNTSTSPINFYTSTSYLSSGATFNITISCFVPDLTPPSPQSAATNTSGNQVTITFNESVESSYADVSDFTVKVGGSPVTLTGVSFSGTDAILTLQNAVTSGQTVTVSYNNTSDGLCDDSYNPTASFTNYAVTNNSTVGGAPTITSFSPTSACPGSVVTITGTNFTGATSVSFGGTAATSFSVVSATSITAVVANGTSGSVSVTTAGGTGTKTGFTMNTSIPGTITYNSAIGAQTIVSDGQAGSTDYCGIMLNVYGANSGLSGLPNAMTYEPNIYPGASGLAANYASSGGSNYIIIKSSNNTVNFSLQSILLIDYGGNNIKIEGFDGGTPTGSINYTTNTDPYYFTLDQAGVLTPSIFQNIDEVRISAQDGGIIWIAVNNIQLSNPVVTPTVSSVSVSPNGTYKGGNILNFKVKYDAAVTVDITNGRPYIPITLNTGGTVNAVYADYSGYDNSHNFNYQIVNGNFDDDGIIVGTAITANGGTLKSADGVDANLTLNNVASTTGVRIDAIAPWVSSVSSTNANEIYKLGDVIAITLSFSEAVTVTGTPTLALNSGGTASYISGSGTSVLTFNYTVGSGQSSSDLDYSSAFGSLLLPAGTTIKDAAGNSSNLNLPTVGGANSLGGQKNIVIGITPTVTTQAVSSISITTATGNGNITSLGIPNPTAYGVCWNTTGEPTTSDSKVNSGAASATGAFTVSMTGLTAGTTYYVRAFATNAAGTSYGSEVSFTTLSTSLSGSAGGTSVAQNDPVYIAPGAVVSGTTLNGAIVSINSNFSSGEDVLGIDGNESGTSGSISYSYDSSKGILTLTGDADVETYQPILRKITYTNTSATPNTSSRSVTISLNKALPYSENGHYYEFVSSSGISWTDAKAAAEELNYYGLKGYLATITSAAENDFCTSKLSGNGWMGASDADAEGIWKWVTGPEAGHAFSEYSYSNWNTNQPDNYNGIEDYAQFYVTGKWNDLPNTESSIVGYVVEYGGLAGDQLADISDEVIVNISVPEASDATNIQSNSFQANWQAVTGAANYYLDVATNSDFTTLISGYNNKNVGNVTTYKVEGLDPVTTYYFRVRATSLESGYNSNISSATTVKADQTIDFEALPSKTYGDIDFSPSAVASSDLTVVYSSSDLDVATIVSGKIHIVGAGSCTIYADQSGNDSYNAAPQVSQLLTVNKAELTVTADNQTKVYGDPNPELTFRYSGWVNGEETIDTPPTISTTVDAASEVNTYANAIALAGGTDNNYTFNLVAGDFEVTKAELTVTADNQTKVYGEANPELTFQYSGWMNGEETIDTPPTISTTVDATSEVNTYANAITLAGGTDNNYTLKLVAGDFEVTKAELTVTADNQTKVYGDANPELTFQYSGWVNGEETIDTPPAISTTVDETTNAGTYAASITLSGGEDNNYTLNLIAGDFEVTKAELTVTADAKHKVYQQENPSLTFQYSGWKNEDDESVLDTKPTASTTVDINTESGIYTDAITISGGEDNNYDFTYIPADFEVNRAVLTVKANNQTKVYGSSMPVLTLEYSGWLNGVEEIDTPPTIVSSVDQHTEVGTYPDAITVSGGSDDNYTFEYVSGDFEVTKSILTVTAYAQSKEYGDENPMLTYLFTGWIKGIEEIDVPPTIFTTVDKSTAAGDYANAISFSGGEDNNFTFRYEPASFRVNKAHLQVSADKQTKVYGDENPVLTYSFAGWKNNDTSADLQVKPVATTAINETTAAGSYPNAITVSGGFDQNYEFNYTPADFEIAKADLTITAESQSKCFDGQAFDGSNSVTFDGFVNGEDQAALGGTLEFSGTFAGATIAGTYSIVPQGLTSENYELNFQNGTLVIHALPTATISGNVEICAGSNAAIEVKLTGEAPWSLTVTDGTTSKTIDNIVENAFVLHVGGDANTSKTYTITSVSDQNGCSNGGTGEAVIQVRSNTLAGEISGDQLVAPGAFPATITSLVPGSGPGTITYAWESSVDEGFSWEMVPDAFDASLAPEMPDQPVWYRRITISTNGNTACSSVTEPVKISLLPTAIASQDNADDLWTAFAIRNTEIRLKGEVSKLAIARLYDVQGKLILVKNLEAGNLNCIPTPGIKTGIYMLFVADDDRIQSFKIPVNE